MAIDFPNSPTTNQTFTVNDTTWTYDGAKWVITASGRTGPSAVTVSDTAPTNPSYGTFWYNSSNGRTYTYYADANSAQWVEVGSADPTFNTLTTKGDILTRSSSAMTRLGVGTTNQVLAANSAATNGIEWVDKPWNTAWGILGIHTRTDIFVSSSPHNVFQDEGLSCSVTYGANRLLKVTLLVRPYTPGGQNFVTYKLLRGSTTIINWGNGYPEISNSEAPCKTLTYTFASPATAGTETFKIQIAGSANTEIRSYAQSATSDGPRQLIIEDIGPA